MWAHTQRRTTRHTQGVEDTVGNMLAHLIFKHAPLALKRICKGRVRGALMAHCYGHFGNQVAM
jgi:hypothetical protein